MAVVMPLGDETISTALFLPFFRRLLFDLLRLFEQALPIELMSFGFRKDPALFFVDMMFD
jgi:hypothetical protein